MPDRGAPTICPIMRELIAFEARQSRGTDALDQGQTIDKLARMEAEAVRTCAPIRTLGAIRARRRQVRIEGLMLRSTGLRGH